MHKRQRFFLVGRAIACSMLLLMLRISQRPSFAQNPSPTPTAAHDTFEGGSLPTVSGQFFVGSGACTNCHTNMVDESGTDVSIDAYWRSTMMANAARDPYWQAAVQIELTEFPQLSATIEDKCASCHMPMAWKTLQIHDQQVTIFGENGLTNPEHPLHKLAMDGNSCTLCHQIQDDNLGQPESFSGGFVIETEDEQVIFSRFDVPDDLAAQMEVASGFPPVQSEHILRSEVCATCHTLYTNTVNDKGEIVGQFPEQVPYLEWLHSDYRDNASCQDCHMPIADGGVVTSITGGPPRSPFSKHTFVGGNAYVMRMFMVFGPEMNVTASSEDFRQTYQRTIEQLHTQTASVDVKTNAVSDSELSFNVMITALTGHKFPTAYPSRRAWLHVRVRDAAGETVFESGAFKSNGLIVDDNHDADPTRYEPHYAEISQSDQVQIYESVLIDTNGNVTATLLEGAGYVKDNRLLPSGFDKQAVTDDSAVQGAALDDSDFIGGGDTVHYRLDVSDAEGPYTILVELLYQSISYNWADKLRAYDDEKSQRFIRYYDAVPNAPVVIDQATLTIENQ